MGRRSRKRAVVAARPAVAPLEPEDELEAGGRGAPPRRRGDHDDAAAEPAPRNRRPPPRSRRLDDRPPAPWDPFPLSELLIFIALVLGIAGLVMWGPRGHVMVACAAVLGSIGGLDVAIREHVAGYRSHSLLLSGTIAMAVIALCYFTRVRHDIMLGAGAATFVLAFWGWARAFRRRAGVGFR